MTSPTGPVIAAHRLTKYYPNGVVGLSDVSLTVDPGEVVALIGPSGSGKTTLFRLCNGALRGQAGELTVLGVPVGSARGARLRWLRRQVAVVYQSHQLVNSLSVRQNVLLGRLGAYPWPVALKEALWPSPAARHAVRALLDELAIGDKIDTRVDELSGGQQQRVAIARALYQRPRLLLADEPVASVDSDTAEVILDLLHRVSRRGTTVLISLHQRHYVERYCDRWLELRAGALVRDERPAAGVAPLNREVLAR